MQFDTVGPAQEMTMKNYLVGSQLGAHTDLANGGKLKEQSGKLQQQNN